MSHCGKQAAGLDRPWASSSRAFLMFTYKKDINFLCSHSKEVMIHGLFTAQGRVGHRLQYLLASFLAMREEERPPS